MPSALLFVTRGVGPCLRQPHAVLINVACTVIHITFNHQECLRCRHTQSWDGMQRHKAGMGCRADLRQAQPLTCRIFGGRSDSTASFVRRRMKGITCAAMSRVK